ncbi:MAG: DUF4936 family protein [Neisseriaceae bacterium]|nr:DUF4936 family protein [Neisseriaceae bacterium]
MSPNESVKLIYIYYKIRESDSKKLAAGLTKMQAHLLAEFDISAEVQRRSEIVEGLQTWMEIYTLYEDSPEFFLPKLNAAVIKAALPALIQGERTYEVFESVW